MSAAVAALPHVLRTPAMVWTMIALRLRLEPAPDGGWRVLLLHRDGRAVTGQVSEEDAQTAQQAAQAARSLAGGPMLLVPGDDVTRAAAELAAGRALSVVLTASPQISAQFAWFRGQARQAREDLLLAIEAEEAGLRALPWELLCADADGLHLEGDGVTVVRLSAGYLPPSAPPRTTLRTLCWRPDEDEPLSGELLDTLREVTAAATLPAPEVLHDAEATFADEAACVLHVLCHGAREQAQLTLLVDEQRRSVGGTAEVLRGVLPLAELVVLSVCEAGAALPGERDGLVGHILGAGARAVVAPVEEWSVEAAAAFLRGLYAALIEGASLPGAVSAGRCAVRALALPYPDARWGELVLTVGSLDLPQRLLQIGWRPAGWPRPSTDAALLLQQAHDLAVASGAGFVGLEHIALALAEMPVDARLSQARYYIRSQQTAIERRLGRLSASDSRQPDWQGTPRLRSLGAHLADDFSLHDLWAVMSTHARPSLRWLLGTLAIPHHSEQTSEATHQSEASTGASLDGPIGALEVMGGPEDGRRLTFHPEARVGRWHTTPRCELTLYAQTPQWDRSLSRDGALCWLRPDLIEAIRALSLERTHSSAQSVTIPPGARCSLQIGDGIRIADATWLLVVGSA